MWMSDYGCKIQRTDAGGGYSYSVAADWANRPVNYVSFWDACRFANWLHNGQPTGAQNAGTTERGAYTLDGYTGNDGREIQRNPGWTWAVTSEDEWYKAAYHKNDGDTGNYFDYPTASDSVPGRDITEATSPGNNANYAGDPWPIDPPYFLTTAGEFELSDSPYGTFDQGGNVWEWNEAIVSEGADWSCRGVRAGSFNGRDSDLHASYRIFGQPTFDYVNLGFRVVAVPEPATLALLALGAAGALLRRRRGASS